MRRLSISDKDSLHRAVQEGIQHNPKLLFFHRLHCVLLVAEGRSCYEVSQWFHGDPHTVQNWVHLYEASGCEGLKSKKRVGRPNKLNGLNFGLLKRDLQTSPNKLGYSGVVWTGQEFAIYLTECHRITLSIRQCQRLLKKLREIVNVY